MQLRLQIKPNARKNEISVGNVIVVRIKAPPVDGKANRELIEYLSEVFGIPKSGMEIIRGESSKFKTISISDQFAGAVRQKLEQVSTQ